MFPPITPYDMPDDPALKDLTDEQRFGIAILQGFIYFVALIAAILICGLCFSSCTTPRVVEEHHHHYYEADTMAVKAQVDRQLTKWHEDMTQFFQQRLEEYSASWFSHEDQKETITETVTVSLDSLGREIRTEQRTITRDISRELQQQEQRLTREYEARLRVAIDSVNSIFQQRFDSLASHQTSDIDHQTSSTPLTSHLPWYQKLWNRLNEVLIIFLIAAFLWFTKKWWLKLLKLLKLVV